MFCPDCGHELQEGHAYCKYCGARLDDAAPQAWAAPEESLASAAVAKVGSGDEPPPALADMPPSGGVRTVSPDDAASPSPPGDPAPAGSGSPPPNNNKVLLIVAAVVIGLLILAGAVFALFVVTGSETGTGDAGPTVTVESVGTGGTASTGTTNSGTNGTGDTTTQSVPSDNPGDTTSTTPGNDPAPQDYIDKLDSLDGTLYDADGKMLAIADKINATTPNIPASVFEDLVGVGEDVMAAYDWLNAETPPPGYEKAHDLILQAGDAMVTRIDKTKQGYLAIEQAGKTDAGVPYFADGKKAKDQFTKLFAEYQQARP